MSFGQNHTEGLTIVLVAVISGKLPRNLLVGKFTEKKQKSENHQSSYNSIVDVLDPDRAQDLPGSSVHFKIREQN
jgi:hypothetical protein